MKLLYQIAFKDKKNSILLTCSLIAALFFTVSTQLEVFALGIVTKKEGADFFELFGKEKDGRLERQERITYEELLLRFQEIASPGSRSISTQEAHQFLEQKERSGIIDRGWKIIRTYLPIESNVGFFIVLLTSAALIKACSLFCYRFSAKAFSIRISQDLRKRYFDHIQKLPLSFYLRHNIGALSSRAVQDGYVIADGINSMVINYIQTPFTIFSTLLLCFSVSWQLSTVIFFGLPFIVAPIIFLARRIKKISKEIQKRQENFSSILIEFISGIQTIKLFSMETFSMEKYEEQNNQLAKLELRSARYDISSRPILHIVGMLCLITALIFGLWGLQLPLYEVLFFCGLLSAVYEPIKKFAEENGRIQRGIAACERMWEVLSMPPERADIEEGWKRGELLLTKEIIFDSVFFGYTETKPVLSNITFTIARGEMVAIVGATGSGKSTIVSLLTNLFTPQSGSITIDGNRLDSFSQKGLRQGISVVPQKPFLFQDTILENIRFGQEYSDSDVEEACKKAHADNFILDLPLGYHTIIAEAGKTLSGGQMQRLAIARALLRKSSILILDEATSALDPISEHHIKQALHEMKGDVTQIIIAHRLSTIEEADRIIVLDEGKKIGEGTFQELLSACPAFARMHHFSAITKPI